MPITFATWNVNGIRARAEQFLAWVERDHPDVICLQEIKASPEKLAETLLCAEEYWGYWHGASGYSGVSLLLRRQAFPEEPRFYHPPFDHETRIVAAVVGGAAGDLTLTSVYVPNGGKDFAAKMEFLEALERWVAELHQSGGRLILGGDLNVARAEMDVHPKERKKNAIGQLPEERERFASLLSRGVADVGRALDPENENLFTWWAPWRSLRQRNIGWRIDYVLASAALAERATACQVLADWGTSDHAPVVATFDLA
ncbi:MAG TPA: exodeoxyribonuclease III [Thermoanaerobaculia bacterium]|nr:exodeoxyribonuclease III [Thermoanaerobaculia bacterium]